MIKFKSISFFIPQAPIKASFRTSYYLFKKEIMTEKEEREEEERERE
jgi:hypothetical protein